MSEKKVELARLLGEGLIPLADVPRLLPLGPNGKRLHRSAPWRWVREGVEGPGRERVYLEAVRSGRRWLTSRQAVARFQASQTPELARLSHRARHARLRAKSRETLKRHGLDRGDAWSRGQEGSA